MTDRTYDVGGTTAAEALKNAAATNQCGEPQQAGCTTWQIHSEVKDVSASVSGGSPPYTAKLTVTGMSVSADVTVTTPKWTGYGDASPAEQKLWDAASDKLKAHEDGHVAIVQ